MDNYKALDQRVTNLQYTRSIIPAIVVGFYGPLFMSLAAPVGFSSRYYWGWIWQPFPLWIAAIQYTCAALGVFKNTSPYDRISAPTRDMHTIRLTMRFCAAVSACVWLYTIIQAPVALSEFLPAWESPAGLWACARNFIAWDHILTFTGVFMWLGLLFRDLKHWEKTDASWTKLCGLVTTTCIVAGPGATAALGWLWREELLADKTMKGALLEGTWQDPASEKATTSVHANGSAKRHPKSTPEGHLEF